jgi:hypothetical protein
MINAASYVCFLVASRTSSNTRGRFDVRTPQGANCEAPARHHKERVPCVCLEYSA